MGSNAYAIKVRWPSGYETIVRQEVLIDAATAVKPVLDILGGSVLVVVDMRYRPRDYRSAWGDGSTSAKREVDGAPSEGLSVPVKAGPRVPSSQGDLLAGRAVDGDSVACRTK
jgi:hypothetical protein